MKPLSSFVAMATVCLILCSASSGRNHSLPAQVSSAKDNTHYFYYLADGDTYDAYNTVADEIARQEGITGEYVDTNPFGGTLLVRGYNNNVYPHNQWPASNLYVHD